ncbi:MAG: DUF2617 family protein [Firmicutes bacterium]|nr:DUF2617 family protein [Bacillota bacterium]
MNKVRYKKLSVLGLEYKLFLSPDLNCKFNVLKNRVINWQGIILDFSIIGLSHFVKIDTGAKNKLIELLACVDSKDIADEVLVQQKNLIACCNYRYNNRFNSFYKYSFITETIDDCLRNAWEFGDKYTDKGCGFYLEYVFPSPDGFAVTSIGITGKEDKFCWITYHSYPADKKIIKTRSIIEKEG